MSRAALCIVALLAFAGCDNLPGKPRPEDRPIRPSEVLDFLTLYGGNCAGCHGDRGRPGAALALDNPMFLALVDDATLRRVIADGVPGTSMPAFARSAGGSLTDAQIDAIVGGLRQPRRSRQLEWQVAKMGMSYAAPLGDAARGTVVAAARCAPCHGADGTGGEGGGSIVDPAYLALVSDQGLRTAVLVGRWDDPGMPDWRYQRTGPPMTPEEVADVVAWMVSKRGDDSDG